MFSHTQTFNNQSIRKTVITFGALFESIYIIRNETDGTEREKIRIPLEYGNKEKFILTQSKDTSGRVQVVLPRMGFEITSLLYDPTRKVNRLNKRSVVVNGIYQYGFSEVPYNIGFGLYIFTRNMEDMLQIVEQIIPYFAPEYTVTVKMNDLHEEVDIPIVLNGVTVNEDYEGPLDTRRTLIGVLDFTAKTYVYPQICGITANNGTTNNGMGILISDVNFYEGRTGVANIAGSNYVSDVGYTGNAITGSITKVTGD